MPTPPAGQGEIVSLNPLTISRKPGIIFGGIQAVHAAERPKAIDAFSDALGIDPQYAKAYNSLGVPLAITGRIGQAEEAFRNAIGGGLVLPPLLDQTARAQQQGHLTLRTFGFRTIQLSLRNAMDNLHMIFSDMSSILEFSLIKGRNTIIFSSGRSVSGAGHPTSFTMLRLAPAQIMRSRPRLLSKCR